MEQTFYAKNKNKRVNNILLSQKVSSESYRRKRHSLQQNHQNRNIIALKKFQQYFTPNRPNFIKQFRNIFQKAKIEPNSISLFDENQYKIQSLISNRNKSPVIKCQSPTPEPNNFTIESLNVKQIYKKAHLNKIITYRESLKQCNQPSIELLQQSGQLVRKIKDEYKKRNAATHNHRFRMSITQQIKVPTMISVLNPNHKQKFSSSDLHEAISIANHIHIKTSPNISYFNVYVEEGNNSDLIKSIVRKRNGWRVVQIPAVANFIWTQFYKKHVLQKRFNKRQKSEINQDQKLSARSSLLGAKQLQGVDSKIRCHPSVQPQKQNTNDNFINQIRKLFTVKQAPNIATLKMPNQKSLKQIVVNHNILIHNHFPQNKWITDKKNLLALLTRHYQQTGRNVSDVLPESYQIASSQHPIFNQLRLSETKQQKQYWIVKPGENSNRGRGIIVCHSQQQLLQELEKRFCIEQKQTISKKDSPLKKKVKKQKQATAIVLQKYIYPLLYNKRKFDIRSYMLLTLIDNHLRLYAYEQCYIRTCSRFFELDSSNKYVHLTNDAIQSQSNDYGKYEQGNKISESVFQKYIDEEYASYTKTGQKIWKDLKKQMHQIYIDIIQSSHQKIIQGCFHKNHTAENNAELNQEPSNRNQIFYFELYGLDFMIDHQFKLWLIEVNTNPSIMHDCSRVLNRLIPKLLNNLIIIAVETIMRPLKISELSLNSEFIAIYSKNISPS